jgi:uncharacterized protein YuzE
VKITYDEEADAAYIYLAYSIGPGEVANTVSLEEAPVNIDFDAQGRLLGIEVLNASTTLAPEILLGAKEPLFQSLLLRFKGRRREE